MGAVQIIVGHDPYARTALHYICQGSVERLIARWRVINLRQPPQEVFVSTLGDIYRGHDIHGFRTDGRGT